MPMPPAGIAYAPTLAPPARQATAPGSAEPAQRQFIGLQGAVQGVGFRPWFAQQAQQLGLSGWVRNGADGLMAECQGNATGIERLLQALQQSPPPLASIRSCHHHALAPVPGESGFRILASLERCPPRTGLPADTAPCAECLAELFDPGNRRWRHPFINCTQCGPRWTITHRLPYDRPATSMAGLAMCADCAAEYGAPANRRHHAQPIACPQCGPQLALCTASGHPLSSADVLADAAQRLQRGQVLAVKGVGGYHLVCDATQARSVQRLRQAKRRPRQPFAVMAANLASARQWVQLGDETAALLRSPQRPILLLPTQAGVAQRLPEIAPGLAEWGLMLPPSPLHLLLLHELAGRPAGTDWLLRPQAQLLLVTSANPGGEPLVIDEAEAVARLGSGPDATAGAEAAAMAPLADALLVHNRPIVSRTDDSVRRPMPMPMPLPATPPGPQPLHAPFVRRARGHVPDPIELPGVSADAPPVLATGGWLKATVCLTRGNEAFLSPHLGDLGSAAARQGLVDAVQRLLQFLAVRPQAVAHDRHPDFFSSHHAQALGERWRVPALAVQHHQAHAAAVLAEHGHPGQALALVLDGMGLGTDGSAWGGELLIISGQSADFERLDHLAPLPMPGGDRATTQPWRLGAALLHQLGRADQVQALFGHRPTVAALAQVLDRPTLCPSTTSAGRLFDAAAALLGLCHHQQHEAEAAMALEACASGHPDALHAPPWPGVSSPAHDSLAAGCTTLWTALADAALGLGPAGRRAEAAARFHSSLSALLADRTILQAERTGIRTVALGGGCFINALLRHGVRQRLCAAGLQVLEAVQAPPGDGGLSLGQAAVALHAIGPDRR